MTARRWFMRQRWACLYVPCWLRRWHCWGDGGLCVDCGVDR